MIPDPLHPAIVHFPIVLLLLGAPLAILSIFWRRSGFPILVAAVLSLGAFGAIVATLTGEQDAEMVGEATGHADQVLDEHEEWGERARNIGIVAALLAMASAGLGFRWPSAGRPVAALAALVSVGAAFAVVQAGHYGGQLVYKNGVGVHAAAGGAPAPARHQESDQD
jgi:uncharacterized membrane protein